MTGPGKPVSSLLVTHSRRWNGETEYATGVLRAEVEMGLRVTLVAPRASILARKLAGSVRYRELPGPRPSSSPRDFFRDLRWLADLIEGEKFQVLHACRATGHLLTALAARRRAPLLHLRGGAKKPYRHPGNRILYRKLTSGVIVSSRGIEDWMTRGLRLPPDRVHRLLAPVDTERFRPAALDPVLYEELGVSRNAPLVVNVARLAPIKGHPVLLEAWAGVLRRIPGAALVLVGGFFEGQEKVVNRKIEELGLAGSVVLTGRRADIPRLLAAASVCVASSLGSEENSRAVGEYMASGRPVAATAVGVIPEMVVDGATGFLVPPGNSEALAGAITSLIEDRERAEEMGAAGRRRAEEEFSRTVFSRRLRDIFTTYGIKV